MKNPAYRKLVSDPDLGSKPDPSKLWCRRCQTHPDVFHFVEESAFDHCGICKYPVYEPIKPSRKPFLVCLLGWYGILIILGIYSSFQPIEIGLLELWGALLFVMFLTLVPFGIWFYFGIMSREKASSEWLSWARENGYKEEAN